MGKCIRRFKQKHWTNFDHYMMVVYRHCQHTFQYIQLVKVHVLSYLKDSKRFHERPQIFPQISHWRGGESEFCRRTHRESIQQRLINQQPLNVVFTSGKLCNVHSSLVSYSSNKQHYINKYVIFTGTIMIMLTFFSSNSTRLNHQQQLQMNKLLYIPQFL